MSSRSILIAVLGLTLNGCAVYDYDDDYDYDNRYYGGSDYSVQRYETYPVYPVYQQRYYRYDYPRYDRHRYYVEPRHDDHRGHDHPRPMPQQGYRPPQQGWDGHRQVDRGHDRRPQLSMPGNGGWQPPQVVRGHERNQERRQQPRQEQRHNNRQILQENGIRRPY